MPFNDVECMQQLTAEQGRQAQLLAALTTMKADYNGLVTKYNEVSQANTTFLHSEGAGSRLVAN